MSFDDRIESTWTVLMDALDSHDIPYQETPQSLSISTSQGVYLLNAQGMLAQLWLSSPVSGAHHFVWQGNHWTSTRSTATLHSILWEEQKWDVGFNS